MAQTGGSQRAAAKLRQQGNASRVRANAHEVFAYHFFKLLVAGPMYRLWVWHIVQIQRNQVQSAVVGAIPALHREMLVSSSPVVV